MKPEKQITLLAVSVIILSAFFILPVNRDWMANRILPYWKDFNYQKSRLNVEERKINRYKSSYIYSKQIADFFHSRNKDSVLVLIPSTSYFNLHGIHYHVPEPVVFYYYTGLKTVWSTNSDAYKAKWFVCVEGKKLIFDSVTNSLQLADTIRSFNQFPPEL
jgi:hypothetical protein